MLIVERLQVQVSLCCLEVATRFPPSWNRSGRRRNQERERGCRTPSSRAARATPHRLRVFSSPPADKVRAPSMSLVGVEVARLGRTLERDGRRAAHRSSDRGIASKPDRRDRLRHGGTAGRGSDRAASETARRRDRIRAPHEEARSEKRVIAQAPGRGPRASRRHRSIPRSASVSAHVDAGPVRPNESPALYGAGLSRMRNRCQWPPSEITGQTNDFTIPMSKAAPAFSAARTSESSSKTPSLPP